MAEPSTLTQTAINAANTDFVRRVTPHPQAASPLQQLIAEDQQAKGDPGNDEIEGLDAEVLLNADALEDGEAVTLDFEGQGETPSSHPPPPPHTPPPPAPPPTPPPPPPHPPTQRPPHPTTHHTPHTTHSTAQQRPPPTT